MRRQRFLADKKISPKRFYDVVIIRSCSHSFCDYDHHGLWTAETGFIHYLLREPLSVERRDFSLFIYFIVLKSMSFHGMSIFPLKTLWPK